MSRLIHSSRRSISGIYRMAVSKKGRFLSTDSKNVEEAETVNVPPPPTEKLLVLGGNGFVGSHICKEALGRGISVASLSRSGRSSIQESWADSLIWNRGNLLSDDSWKEALNGVTAVISCVGGFGSNSYMYKINGTANINAIRAAAEQGVKRFVYISAADFGIVNYLLQGYYEGKFVFRIKKTKVTTMETDGKCREWGCSHFQEYIKTLKHLQNNPRKLNHFSLVLVSWRQKSGNGAAGKCRRVVILRTDIKILKHLQKQWILWNSFSAMLSSGGFLQSYGTREVLKERRCDDHD